MVRAEGQPTQRQKLDSLKTYMRIHVQGIYHSPEERQEAADSRARVRATEDGLRREAGFRNRLDRNRPMDW